jgi:hypothetical protein
VSPRHASRPAIVAVPLPVEFYTRKIEYLDAVCYVSDVKQMFMLGLAPLFKDFGLLTPGHKVTPLLVRRWRAHPQHDMPLKDYFAGQSWRLPIGPDTDNFKRRQTDRDADAFMHLVSNNLAAANLHYA